MSNIDTVFESSIEGIPCTVMVTYYNPEGPVGLTEFEFALIDENGNESGYLEHKVKDRDTVRFLEEYEQILEDV